MTGLFLLNLVYVVLGTQKPNIILMVVDDLGWTDVGYHNAEFKTPNLDNLVETGIELTNYHVHLDCSPTRSAILTGQYSFKNGLQSIQTVPPATLQHIPFENPTIGELLLDAGYETHFLGKWHLGCAAWNMTAIGRGFMTNVGYFNGAEDYYTKILGNGYDFWNNKEPFYSANTTYGATVYYKEMENIIKNYAMSNQENPLFTLLAFQTIHTPIIQDVSPQNFSECEGITNVNRTVYCNKLIYLDTIIGNIVDDLKSHNLWDDTVLFLTTDNGGMPYWSSNANYLTVSWGCNEPLRAGKATLFEGGVRGIGFINGGNNLIPNSLRGSKSDILTHAIDILPTLVNGFAGIELPDNVPFDGINMWDTIANNAEWNRTLLYLDIEQNGTFAAIKDIKAGWKYIRGRQMYDGYFPCINGNYTPYDSNSTGKIEYLFKINQDPYETNDVAHEFGDITRHYAAMIQDFIQNGGYIQEQDTTQYNEGKPHNNNGLWGPWLS
mmetsp:Transcript_31850/g.39129  ORF Transcript_31850/g.39129 Transcript_31850/m.39129 type:complete len:494 (+) Transcript_31850:35-1516(+)